MILSLNEILILDYSDIQVDDEYEDEEVLTASDESSDPGK